MWENINFIKKLKYKKDKKKDNLINSLPNENILIIYNYLKNDIKSLLNLSRTCKRLHNIFKVYFLDLNFGIISKYIYYGNKGFMSILYLYLYYLNKMEVKISFEFYEGSPIYNIYHIIITINNEKIYLKHIEDLLRIEGYNGIYSFCTEEYKFKDILNILKNFKENKKIDIG